MKNVFVSASAVLAMASLSSSACVTHTAVGPVPDATATLDERAGAYDRLKPSIMPSPVGPRLALTLADGTLVEDPKDLAPAVPSGSPTLAHAQKAADAESIGNGLTIASIAVVSIGTAAMLGSLAYSVATTGPRGEVSGAAMIGVIGGGALTVASALSLAPVMGMEG